MREEFAFNPQRKMNPEREYENAYRNAVKEIGESEAINRFLSKYGNWRTKAIYACEIKLYLRHLKEGMKVGLTPDQLITDNLECIFKSDATDVRAKRKHTDWLSEYVNDYLIKRGTSEAHRELAASVVKAFYKRNDSLLYGDFSIAQQPLQAPRKALKAEDIRAVLTALPLNIRAPLLVEWQSSIEINRVLSLSWTDLKGFDEGEHPVKIELYGRKKHRRGYLTFIGKDSIDHLKALDSREGAYVFPSKSGNFVNDNWLNRRMRGTAMNLMKQGLIDQYPPESWHSHALRHSFETEASHAGVRAEFRDFFLGHVSGIQWIYNHRDELHPEDLVKEYLKIEPLVSLSPNEATLRNEYEQKENVLLKRLENLERLYAELKREASLSQ